MKYMMLVLLWLVALPVLAAIDVYQFDSDEQQQRYRQMIDELRCPKCQNQNLAGSDAPIAQDLRRELHRLISEGQNEQQIRTFMVQRYGNFILYRPPLDQNTLLLWGLPLLLLLVGGLVAVRLRAGRQAAALSSGLQAQEQARLDALLEEYR
ncbi:MAG TPA: cytochrome c-type biogenesis protein [Pseudomonadales bacterium]